MSQQRKIDPIKATEMHADGMSDYAIARFFGVSHVSVYNLRQTLGLPKHDLPRSFSYDAVRELHADGLNDRQIAERLGTSNQSIYRVRKIYGLKANGKAKT